jgi:2-polyprenyl-3-methyl-5-hydroxy-6-metoxy-1,4-benzoquinol methylase
MPLFLTERNNSLTELMDDPDCDIDYLYNTYRHFSIINKSLSGWKHIFNRYILPECKNEERDYSLLDIGFGGGDIPLHLDQLAKKQGIELRITGIETDKRSLNYVSKQLFPTSISFRHQSLKEILESGERFDFVISNHLLHHLLADDVATLCNQSAAIARKKVLFNDLRRSALAWGLFNALTVFGFKKSFIRTDGLISIRKSFSKDELQQLAPSPYVVESLRPFRLLLYLEKHHDNS